MTLQFSPSGLIHVRTYNFYYLEVVFLKLWTYYNSIGSPLWSRDLELISSLQNQLYLKFWCMICPLQCIPKRVHTCPHVSWSTKCRDMRLKNTNQYKEISNCGHLKSLFRPTAHCLRVFAWLGPDGDSFSWRSCLTVQTDEMLSLFVSFSLLRYGFESGGSACIM